jgi:hypothetical protein
VKESTLEVLQALQSNSSIPRADVCRWMADSDLETRALIYELTDKGWSRISPEPTMDERCAFISAYLLTCIETNQTDQEYVHSGFEAAWELAAWLKHLRTLQGTEKVIAHVVRDLEELYRRSDAKTRNRIETGAVEHILEDKRLRKFFLHWREDPELTAAYELCLEWGKAHEL